MQAFHTPISDDTIRQWLKEQKIRLRKIQKTNRTSVLSPCRIDPAALRLRGQQRSEQVHREK